MVVRNEADPVIQHVEERAVLAERRYAEALEELAAQFEAARKASDPDAAAALEPSFLGGLGGEVGVALQGPEAFRSQVSRHALTPTRTRIRTRTRTLSLRRRSEASRHAARVALHEAEKEHAEHEVLTLTLDAALQ